MADRPADSAAENDVVSSAFDAWGPPPAFRSPTVAEAEALAAVYAEVDARLEALSSACRACGDCCTFGPDRPVLFASSLELAHLVAQAGAPARDRQVQPGRPDAPWRCPYQEGGLCMARAARTLGCRTYFCDGAARRRGEALYAEVAARIRRLVADSRRPWWYGPARQYLAGVPPRA